MKLKKNRNMYITNIERNRNFHVTFSPIGLKGYLVLKKKWLCIEIEDITIRLVEVLNIVVKMVKLPKMVVI